MAEPTEADWNMANALIMIARKPEVWSDRGKEARAVAEALRDARSSSTAVRTDEIRRVCEWLDSYQDRRYSDAATHIRCNYFDPGQPGEELPALPSTGGGRG